MLKSVLSIGASVLVAGAALAAPAKGTNVIIDVGGVASGRGALMVSLCTREEFLRRCALSEKVAAHRGRSAVVFRGIKPGFYAVMAYHDENGNGRLDRTSIGMPSEGYGFSRNASGSDGPPTFDAASISVPPAGGRTALSLRY